MKMYIYENLYDYAYYITKYVKLRKKYVDIFKEQEIYLLHCLTQGIFFKILRMGI